MNLETDDAMRLDWLDSLTPLNDVMKEFREIGRSAFLQKHELSRSLRWFIDDGRHYYDAEAIITVASKIHHRMETRVSAKERDIASDAIPAALARLGLTVIENPYRFLVLANNESHARAEFAKWQDVTGERYHFPNGYRNRILPGREFIYYKGARRKDGSRAIPEYFGWGRVGAVYPDVTTTSKPKGQWHWLCDIEDYYEFVAPVPFKDDRGYYVELNTATPPQRYWENGVRLISERTFRTILAAARVILKPQAIPVPAQSMNVTVVSEQLELLVKPSLTNAEATGTAKRSVRRSARAKEIGDFGEKLFLEWLQKQTASAADREKIRWIANLGETPGWDIEDLRTSELIAYEVKATNGPKLPAIEITANEWGAAERLRGRYNLVLIAECESSNPKIQVINDPWHLVETQLLESEPVLFRLTRR